MDGAQPPQIPSFIVGWLESIIGGLFAMLLGTWVWLFRKFDNRAQAAEDRLADVEKSQKEEALRTQLLVAELVSRKELTAHMQQMRDDLADREDRDRKEGDRRHAENRQQLEKLVESVNCVRADNREDIGTLRTEIRSVHARIDDLK